MTDNERYQYLLGHMTHIEQLARVNPHARKIRDVAAQALKRVSEDEVE